MAVRTNIQLSLLDPDENPAIVVTGDQLRQLSETELDQILKFREIVFSRTSPQQKLTIVEAVQVKLCSLPFQSRNSSPPPLLPSTRDTVTKDIFFETNPLC